MIFISGAGSFSGVNLIKYFLMRGESVISNYRTDNLNTKSLIKLRNPELKLIKCDLNELRFYEKHLSSVKTIIHLAGASSPPANNTERFLRDNILGTAELLRLSKVLNCRDFIFASSISVHGEFEDSLVTKDTKIINPSAYGSSKYFCELLLRDGLNSSNLAILRLPAVIGKGAGRHLLASILNKAMKNEPIEIFNPESLFNNAIHINDLCMIIERLIMTEKKYTLCLPVGAGLPAPVDSVVRMILGEANSRSRLQYVESTKKSFTIDIEPLESTTNLKIRSILEMIKDYVFESLDQKK